jgi:hypothetical protein
MLKLNFLLAAATALIPLLVGFIWYNPKVFGKAWMAGAGVTEEDGKKANMPLVFGLTFIYSFMIALSLHFMTIHQFGLQSLLIPENGHPITGSMEELKRLMDIYGGSYRTFKHGALHGTITGIFFALPVVAVNGLFEHRGWKYILINAGFWTVCCAIMGGIICQFA